MALTEREIRTLNEQFKESPPAAIVQWAISFAKKPVVTTNFRPYEVAILEAVTQEFKEIPVIWCDTGYNTFHTYRHASELIARFNLNLKLYVPKQSSAYRDVIMGIPAVDDPKHSLFTEQVKLEPFQRAMEEHLPDVWFTNLRQGQTSHRDSLDIFSLGKEGLLKVSPFYYWSDSQLDDYLLHKELPNEHNYFDPTKVLENRECGLHT